MIYLDSAATTQIDPEVLDAMMPYFKEEYGNAGTIYGLGRRAADAIQNARRQVADFIGAKPDQIIFTSGGSEANSLVFFGLRHFLIENNRKNIVTSLAEHDSVLNSVKNLCLKGGFNSSYLSINTQGTVMLPEVRELINERIGLASIMYVNNETGSENPVYGIGEICAAKNVFFHTDCVQAAGCNKIDVSRIGCDFLSLSSHKLHGPKGVGALYVKYKNILSPIIYGGGVQEFGVRGGTENVAGIVGFGKACELTANNLREIDIHTSVLKQVFFNRLIIELSKFNLQDTIHINGDSVIKHGKILNIRFDGVDGETLLLMLDSYDAGLKNLC